MLQKANRQKEKPRFPAACNAKMDDGLRMALGLGATGEVLLQVRLFGHDLDVTGQAALMLQGGIGLFLGVHHIVQAVGPLLVLQVVMTAGGGALGIAFLAVHRVVADDAFHGLVGGVVEGHRLLGIGTLQDETVSRDRGLGRDGGHGQGQSQDTGRQQGELHDNLLTG